MSSRPRKYQKIIDIKHENPGLSWTAAARKAGFTEGNFTASGSYTPDGKAIPKVKNPKARKRQAQNRLEDLRLDQALIDELNVQARLGNVNIQDYLDDRKRREKQYQEALDRYRAQSGVSVDDGHMTTRKNNSPDARAPELSRINQAKGANQPLSRQSMLDAGLPTNDVEDLMRYMVPSQLPEVGIDERVRMLSGEISGQQALAIADQQHAKRASAIADILKARATKAAGKLIPGLDLAISAAEVAEYVQMGRYDQAAIAGLSGIIGFVPGGGDLIAAGLDGINGMKDIERYNGTSAGSASFANAFDSLRTNKIRGRSGAVQGT